MTHQQVSSSSSSMVSNSSSSSSSSGGVGVAVAAAGAKSTKKPRHRAHQPHFSELPAVRADGARCDGSGTPGLAPAHISGGAAVEGPDCCATRATASNDSLLPLALLLLCSLQ